MSAHEAWLEESTVDNNQRGYQPRVGTTHENCGTICQARPDSGNKVTEF